MRRLLVLILKEKKRKALNTLQFYRMNVIIIYTGFVQSWILEKDLNFPDVEKVWKMIKSLFFQSYKCLISDFVFPVVKSHSISPVANTFHHKMRSFITILVTVRLQCIMKKAWFLCFSRSLLITYCNLESGKRILFWKKPWILDPNICTSPVLQYSVLRYICLHRSWTWQV